MDGLGHAFESDSLAPCFGRSAGKALHVFQATSTRSGPDSAPGSVAQMSGACQAEADGDLDCSGWINEVADDFFLQEAEINCNVASQHDSTR
eukprot:1160892-Pelagomonas_calceolata.AAC.9